MKEITRIHIAKVPYDIEIPAKKEIERYLDSLDSYVNDKELIQDIEIRITELLGERGIGANGVIALDDVLAIRKQLGEAKDFFDDNENETKAEPNIPEIRRKLYRDTDGAILGGVMSGFAYFFGVETVWMRIAFVTLMFFSGGALLLPYLVLWVVIPAAKTSTEKINMTGKPVNLSSIREMNENESDVTTKRERTDLARRIISFTFGSLFLIISISIAMATIMAAIGIERFGILENYPAVNNWEYITSLVLAVTAGFLLATLFAVLSYATFVRRFSNKTAVSIAVIIAMGLISFGTAVGLVTFKASEQFGNTKSTAIELPINFSTVNKLHVDVDFTNVKYIVDDEQYASYETFILGNKPDLSVENGILSIDQPDGVINGPFPTLTIHGPKIDSIVLVSGYVGYTGMSQDLTIEAEGHYSVLSLDEGVYEKLSIKSSNNSTINSDSVYVESLDIRQGDDSVVNLGIVKNLTLTQPKFCADDAEYVLSVKEVTSGVMSYNGKNINVDTLQVDCGSVFINN